VFRGNILQNRNEKLYRPETGNPNKKLKKQKQETRNQKLPKIAI